MKNLKSGSNQTLMNKLLLCACSVTIIITLVCFGYFIRKQNTLCMYELEVMVEEEIIKYHEKK